MQTILIRHYQQRLEEFRRQNSARQQDSGAGPVVFAGDSLTEAFHVSRYFADRWVENRGIAADHISGGIGCGLMVRLAPELFARKPSRIFLLIGVNDIAEHHKPERFVSDYRNLVEKLRQLYPTSSIIAVSLAPTRGNYAHLNPTIRYCNDFLREYAAAHGMPYLDLHRQLVDAGGELRRRYSIDGLHLTPLAYWVWRDKVRQLLGWPKEPYLDRCKADAIDLIRYAANRALYTLYIQPKALIKTTTARSAASDR